MDFLNKPYGQVVELFRSMSPAARITTALLFAVLVAAVFYLFHYQVSGDGELLLSGREFSQSELAEMEAAFGKAGLSGSRVEGNRIRIPRGMKAEYLAALADNGSLPHDFADIIDQVFASENAFTGSADLREQKLKNAREKYISMVVSKMEGVEWATVRYDKDQSRGLRPKVDTRMGVAVKPRGSSYLDAERVQAIRNTVAAFVAGLKLENVTVTDLNAGRAFVGTSSTSDGADSAYAANKARYESDWRQKVLTRLAVYPGVVVGVDVELDPRLRQESSKFNVDPKSTVPIRQGDLTQAAAATEPDSAGPGAASNGVGNTPTAISQQAGTKSETEESQSQSDVAVAQERSNTVEAPLIPKKVKVSIGVPSSYYEKVWHERNPPKDGAKSGTPDAGELARIEQEVKKEIEEAVVNLVPVPDPGVSPYVPIRVTSFTDIPPAVTSPPSMTDTATSWLAGNWPTIGMTLLGLMSLVMLRGMLRSSAAKLEPEPQAAQLAAAAAAEDEEAEEEPAQPRKLRVRRDGGPSLRDELVEMVNEDPDAAANVLRNWIGDAA